MRAALLSLLMLLFAGCAYLPTERISSMQFSARDGGVVYYGSIRREGLALVRLTVEVERRVYDGNLELTKPNATYGLYERYGARDAAPKTADVLERTNYTRAILSSSDQRTMKCDFTDVGGANPGGICVDDFQRIFDVVFG